MLQRVQEVKGFKLGARDGEIGKVDELYFDDRSWMVRYLVADTGTWLTGRQVLISPFLLDSPINDDRVIPVNLTRTQIENSPSLETHVPVSRQFEMEYYPYYGLSSYWNGPLMGGSDVYSLRPVNLWPDSTLNSESTDPHLRSTRDVSGHSIQAQDGALGHVEDFVVDDEDWVVRYLIVDLRNWLPGKKVLISTRWIQRISWEDSTVFTNLSRSNVKSGPEYTEGSQIGRDYETELHQYHNREGYWADELIPAHAF